MYNVVMGRVRETIVAAIKAIGIIYSELLFVD